MGWRLLQQFYRRPDLQSKIPKHEHSIYVFMLFTAKDDGTGIFPSLKLIAQVTNHSERVARAIVSDLEKEGLFTRVELGRGRGNTPLWHVPLAEGGPLKQKDWITPKKPDLVDQADQAGDRRGQKQRKVRLVKPNEPFLDDQEAVVEYQPGYQPQRQLSVVRVTDATSEAEMERALIEEFHATLTQALEAAAAKIVYRQQKLDETVGAAGRRIMQRLLDQAQAEYDELLATQQQQQQIQTKRREVL